MTLSLRIEYDAQWGSELFVYTGQKVPVGSPIPADALPLGNDGNGHWFVEVESGRFEAQTFHYAVVHQGIVVDAEWGNGHRLAPTQTNEEIPTLRVWNTWLRPSGHEAFCKMGFTQAIFRRQHGSTPVLPGPDSITFRIEGATIRPEHKIALIGNIPELGAWDTTRAIVAEPDGLPYWRVTIDRSALHYPIYYKFILVDSETGTFVQWEDRPNRFFDPTAFYPGDTLIIDDLLFANPLEAWRGVGISVDLNHYRSAASCAVGEFPDLKYLIDWVAATGMKAIQMQPVNDCGEAKDPNRVRSGYALDVRYVCPTLAGTLNDARQMEQYEHKRAMLNSLPKVKLAEIEQLKTSYLQQLYAQESDNLRQNQEYAAFVGSNDWWLDDYAQWMEQHEQGEADFVRFVQFHLHCQLKAMRDYAREKGVLLMGTTPHGIQKHGVDADIYRRFYNLGLRESHSYLAQVRQQRANHHPTFNWFALENDNYQLLHNRLNVLAQYYDACQATGLLGYKQETSEFWHIIADKAMAQMKKESPILLYNAAAPQELQAGTWYEAQSQIGKMLQRSQEMITILPLDYWLQLAETKEDVPQSLDQLSEATSIQKIIHIILTNYNFVL